MELGAVEVVRKFLASVFCSHKDKDAAQLLELWQMAGKPSPLLRLISDNVHSLIDIRIRLIDASQARSHAKIFKWTTKWTQRVHY